MLYMQLRLLYFQWGILSLCTDHSNSRILVLTLLSELTKSFC